MSGLETSHGIFASHEASQYTIELESKVKRRFAKVSIVSYSYQSLNDNCVGVPIAHLLTVGSTSV